MDNSNIEIRSADSSEFEMWNEGEIGENGETGAAATLDMEKDGHSYEFSQFPNSATADDEANDDDDTAPLTATSHPVWSFAYYQIYFDVTTTTVLERLKASVLPVPSRHLNKKYTTHKNPDLYGPVWICATLVVVISVCSNLNTLLNHWPAMDSYRYTPQFELVSVAGAIVYSYAFVVPLLLYAVVRWRSAALDFSIADFISSYGYSLFAFVPTAFLLLIRNEALNWLLIAVALSLSGAVLALSVWPAVQQTDDRKTALLLVGVVLALHVGVVVGIKLYFFNHAQVFAAGAVTVVGSNTTVAGHVGAVTATQS